MVTALPTPIGWRAWREFNAGPRIMPMNAIRRARRCGGMRSYGKQLDDRVGGTAEQHQGETPWQQRTSKDERVEWQKAMRHTPEEPPRRIGP